jgi:hypothetical protein
MVIGLLSTVIANAAAFLITHAVWRKIRTGDGPMNTVLFMLVRILLIQVVVLAAGVGGFLRHFPLVAAAIAILAAVGGEWRKMKFEQPLIGRFAAIVTAAVLLRLLLQVWFLCPYSGDALAYHLPKVAEWIRAGGFTREMGTDPCASFPAGFELVETWWCVFLRHDALIEMAGVEFAVLAFFSVRALASHLGLGEKAAWLSGLIYVSIPLFALQTVSCYNDGPAAAIVLAAAALLAGRAHFSLVLIPIGLAAGVKGTALYAILPFLLLWRRKDTKNPASFVGSEVAMVLALSAGAFWYVRNMLWFGNPLHPLTKDGFDFGGVHVQAGPSLESLGLNFSGLIAELLPDKLHPYQALSFRQAGWGIIPLGFGLVGLIQAAREDARFRRAAAVFVVSLLTALLMVSHDGWYARFILFFPAILCIGAAYLTEKGQLFHVAVAASLVVQFVSVMAPRDADLKGLVVQPWQERTSATFPVPKGERVAVYVTGRSPIYPLYQPDFGRKVVYIRARGAIELIDDMRHERIRYAYIDVVGRHRQAQVEEFVKNGTLRSLGMKIYKLED